MTDLRRAWRSRLATVTAVTATPFAGDRSERIDFAGLERNIAHVVGGGVTLIAAGGNTGEFAALSEDEVVDVVATHARAIAGRATLLAGIGYRLPATIALGRRALAVGADGLLVHQPVHPYAGERGLLEYYRSLSDGLPDAPLVLYLRGTHLTPAGAAALQAIDSVVGVKVGVRDAAYFASLADAAPALAWVCGVAEEHAAAFARVGSIGFTSGIANFAPQLSVALHDAVARGDREAAEEMTTRLLPIERLRAAGADANNVAVIKAALDMCGLAGGRLRPPLAELDVADRAKLAGLMRELELITEDAT